MDPAWMKRFLVVGVLLGGLLVACQSPEETTEAPDTAAPTSAVTEAVAEAATEAPPPPTAAATETAVPTEAQPSPTSPVPTPTPPLTATPSPTPPPDPTFYTVQPGDTLISIADQFDVTIDALRYANGAGPSEDFALFAGAEIQIPLCETYRVVSGNTLSGIADFCDTTLDELVTANLSRIAPLGSLDAIPVGFDLRIPQRDSQTEIDCTIQPAREQVIEYRPAPDEGLFCLSQRFDVSTTALIQANVERLTDETAYGETALLIPPSDGAIYVVGDEAFSNGVTVADIAAWYGVEPEAVQDWNGNPVTDPLTAGQQLYIPGADLTVGQFDPAVLETVEESESGEEGDAATATPEPGPTATP
ncbi:MAG: LysM domain-containing protein [Candidatus Promineifilaceae bacterium]|nr:LysM domain-containing protein [Candidatus Promineifilaceae bacterium]